MIIEFKLEKAARKTGGDRYIADYQGKEWQVYFPQEISRPNGELRTHIKVSLEDDSNTKTKKR